MSEKTNSLESQLLIENIGFIVARAKMFKPNSVTDIDDYKQAGYLALLKAIRKYDPSMDCKLTTFAWKAVYHEMIKEASKFSNIEQHIDFDCPQLEKEDFWEYVPNLSKTDSNILWMRLSGHSLQEIGDIFGESKQSIGMKLQKIIDNIKECNEKAKENISSRRS